VNESPRVDYQTEPSRYRHWKLSFEGPIATLAADFDEDVLAFDGLGFGFRFFLVLELALEGDLGEVAVGEGAIFFDGLHGGAGVDGALELFVEFGVGEGGFGFFDLDFLVALDGEGRQHLKDGLEAEGLAVVELQVRDLGLGDGLDALLFNFRAEVRGQDAFDYVLLDGVVEAAADEGLGHFSGAKAGDAGLLLVPLDNGTEGIGDFVGGNFDFDFAGAGRVQRGAVLMLVIVVVPLVVVVLFGSGGFFLRSLVVVDGLCRSQRVPSK